jgi:predicted dehydrogenase
MTDARAPVRIGVAGAGAIGRRHLELIAENADVVLCGIADPAPATAGLAERLRVKAYPTLETMLDVERPDGVILATPNRLHVDNALACIERGIAALVEKPLADGVDEGLRIVRAAERAGVPILVGHHRRHSPILAEAKRVIDGGALGRLVAVAGTALFHKPDTYFTEAPWRREPGGGPILINLIHEIDDLRLLCGDIVAVQATTSRATRGFAVEDTAAISLSFANGALGSFLLSDAAASARSWEQTSGENRAYPHADDEDCYLVAGTRGSLAVPTMRLKTYPGTASWFEPFESTVVAVRRDDPLARQLAHFVDVARGAAAPLVTARSALETLRVTLAVDHAARTGTVVATEASP